MNDYNKAVADSGPKKSPWLSPPIPKRPYDCDAEINEWFEESPHENVYLFDLFGSSPLQVAVLTDLRDKQFDPTLRNTFEELLSQWKEETWFLSSVKKRMSHPAYLKIICMGAAALPLIFDSLRKEPDHWFGALEAITRENPAPRAENMYQLRDAWLEWAASHGY